MSEWERQLDAWQAIDPGRRIWSITAGKLPVGQCHVRLSDRRVVENRPRWRCVSGAGATRAEAVAQALRLWVESYGKDG